MISDPRSALETCSQKIAPTECLEDLSCAWSVNLACEVWVDLCFRSRSISASPLCSVSVADQVLNGGQEDPLPGAMLRTSTCFSE